MSNIFNLNGETQTTNLPAKNLNLAEQIEMINQTIQANFAAAQMCKQKLEFDKANFFETGAHQFADVFRSLNALLVIIQNADVVAALESQTIN